MRRRLPGILLLLVLVSTLLLGWLLYSESGLRWLYARALPLVPGKLEVQRVSGTLADRVILQGMAFSDASVSLQAEELVLRWNPVALLRAEIDLASLQIKQLDVELEETPGGKAPETSSDALPRLELPFDLRLGELDIDHVELRHGEQRFRFAQVALRAAILGSRVEIERLALQAADLVADADQAAVFDFDLQGEIDTAGNYPHWLELDWQTRLANGSTIASHSRLDGNLDATQLSHQSSGALRAELALRLQNLLQNPQWQATLKLDDIDTARFDTGLPEASGSVEMNAEGDLDSAGVTGQMLLHNAELGDIETRFDLSSLEAARFMDGVNIASLQLDIHGGQLTTRGTLYWSPALSWEGELEVSGIDPAAMFPAWPGELNASIQSSGTIENEVLELRAQIVDGGGRLLEHPFTLQGDLHWHDDHLTFESVDIQLLEGRLALQGQLFLSPVLRWQAELEAREINPAALLPDWPGGLNASIQNSGQLQDDALEVSIRIEDASGMLRDYPFSGQGDLQWRDDRLDIEFARLQSGDTLIEARGHSGDRLDLEWSLDSQDLAELYPSATGRLQASGHLGGEVEAPIISALLRGEAISFESYRAASIDAEIEVDLLNWEQLEIQLAATQLDLHGQALHSLEIDGNQRQLNASLVADQVSATLEFSGQLIANGWSGKLLAADIKTIEFSDWRLQEPVAVQLGKEATSVAALCLLASQKASACVEFHQQQESWQANFNLASFPLQLLRPWTPPDLELKGLIDSKASLSFDDDAGMLGQLDASLSGGRATYALQNDQAGQFDFELGELRLQLDPQRASAYSRLLLDNGDRLEGSLIMPRVDFLNFDSAGQSIEGNIEISVQNWLVLDRLLPQIENPGGRLEAKIDLSGSLAEPRLQGGATLRDGRFTLSDSSQTVEQINVSLLSEGSNKVNYDIGAATAKGEVAIQGSTRLGQEHGWESGIEISARDVDIETLVQPWFEHPLSIDGRVKAEARLEFRAPDLLHGQITLDSTQGQIIYPLMDEENQHSQYRDALVSINMNEDGIAVRSDVKIGSSNGMSAQFDLAGARLLALDPEQQAINGKIEASLEELGLVHYLIPDIDKVQGQLDLAMTLAGKLAQPRLRATASMQNASVEIPRLGLNIEQLNLQGSSDDNDRFNFEITAQSGGGNLSIAGSGNLDPAAGWPATLQIKGEDFEVARIPEAQVTISPDLTITIEEPNVRIEGNLLVPFAQLEPRDFSSAAKVSRDSVIIDDEKPADGRWQVSTRVNLTLGERVNFLGYGFQGRLGGGLMIVDVPGKVSTGNGEITIHDGLYRAYGQRLQVTEGGRLLFSGGSLDNPNLDLRAIRPLPSVTVGVLVHGRLLQPKIELFSNPSMNQTDILSYLVLGRPMESSSSSEGDSMAHAALALGLAGGDSYTQELENQLGVDEVSVESSDDGEQTSLVVGRYLSPDMYVSYGVGLVESLNTVRLRYRLAERWHVQAETGAYHGADLLFTIER